MKTALVCRYPRIEETILVYRYRPLPRNHPNIVRLLTAFTDDFRILSDAREKYPAALPEYSAYDLIIDQPRTLYIVMKRCSFRPPPSISQVYHDPGRLCPFLPTELLDRAGSLRPAAGGLRLPLRQPNITEGHEKRQYTSSVQRWRFVLYWKLWASSLLDAEAPHLVISDFGCALAVGSWKLPYAYVNYPFLKGIHIISVRNMLILVGIYGLGRRKYGQPARIPKCRVYLYFYKKWNFRILDFRMADSWAAGTIAYEIFTRSVFSRIFPFSRIGARLQ